MVHALWAEAVLTAAKPCFFEKRVPPRRNFPESEGFFQKGILAKRLLMQSGRAGERSNKFRAEATRFTRKVVARGGSRPGGSDRVALVCLLHRLSCLGGVPGGRREGVLVLGVNQEEAEGGVPAERMPFSRFVGENVVWRSGARRTRPTCLQSWPDLLTRSRAFGLFNAIIHVCILKTRT